ncbi:MAG: sugar kinase [Clostridium sp.]
MKKVLVLGELLIRLTPQNKMKFCQSKALDIFFGGAEANVAVGLANMGIESKILSCIPNNDIGIMCKRFFEGQGVDCTDIFKKEGSRLGVYYYEEECSARKGKVIYDRVNSAITELKEKDFKYEEVFKDVELLHVSGITFGLGEEITQLGYKIVEEAKKRKIKISVDLNYRQSLFKNYSEFYKRMLPIIKDAYICFGWLTEGVEKIDILDGSKINSRVDIKEKLEKMKKHGIKYIATTIREGFPTGEAKLTGVIYDGENFIESDTFKFSMISRIGGGDAFSAGIIKKLLEKDVADKQCVNYGIGSAVLKHTIIGDAPISSNLDINEFLICQNVGSVSR